MTALYAFSSVGEACSTSAGHGTTNADSATETSTIEARRRQVVASSRKNVTIPPAVARYALLEKVRKSAAALTTRAIVSTATARRPRPSWRRAAIAPRISGAAMASISPKSPTLKKVSLEKSSLLVWRAAREPKAGIDWIMLIAPPRATDRPTATSTRASRRRLVARISSSTPIATGSMMPCIRTVRLDSMSGERSVERAARTSRATVAIQPMFRATKAAARTRAAGAGRGSHDAPGAEPGAATPRLPRSRSTMPSASATMKTV